MSLSDSRGRFHPLGWIRMGVIATCVGLVRCGLLKRLRARQTGLATTTLVTGVIILTFYFNLHSNRDGFPGRTGLSNIVNFHENEQPNRTWMKLRKELLRLNGTTAAKVMVFSYMRGGTTIFSEIFNLNPSTDVLWHEPMDAFYQFHAGFEAHSIPLTLLYSRNLTRRLKSDFERSEITNYLENLLLCRPGSLPLETFVHFHLSYSSAFKAVHECMEKKSAKALLLNCTLPLRPVCGHADLIRRDMALSSSNKCPELIAALKALMPKKSLVESLAKSFSEPGAIETNTSAVALTRLREQNLGEIRRRLVTQFTDFSSRMEPTINLLLDRQLCLAELESRTEDCVQPAFDVCGKARLSSIKLIRLMFDDLEEVVRRVPDLHVIYYARDPRAIAISRADSETHLTMSNQIRSVVTELKVLCRRMKEDLVAKTRLERKYPGLVTTIRYEDFVRNPLEQIKEVFDQINRPLPSDIHQWIRSRFNGTEDNGIYGTVRMEPVLTSTNWMSKTSLRAALEMEKHCHDVIRQLGYVTLSTEYLDSSGT